MEQAIELATPNPCLERPALVDDVEAFLERDAIDARVRVKVGETSGTPWFSIRLGSGEPTSRSFVDLPADCEEMRHVVALSIAFAIDALAPEVSAPRTLPRAFVLADAMIATPLPDRMLLGGSAAVRARTSEWFLPGIGLIALVSAGQHLGSVPGLSYDTRLLAVRVEGCFATPASRVVDAVLCLGPWLGSLMTDPSGLPGGAATSTFWGGASAALELHVHVTPWFGVHAGADGLLAFRRSRVEARTSDGTFAIQQKIPPAVAGFRFGPTLFF